MYKVLIIDFFPHQSMGGGQKYSREVIKILKDSNCVMDELCFWKNDSPDIRINNDKTNQFFIFENKKLISNALLKNIFSIHEFILAKRYLKKFLDENDYDLIIDNCTCISINKKYENKLVFVQHVNESVLFNWKRELIRKIMFIKASFHTSHFNIVFTKENEKLFTNYLKGSKNIPIPLFVEKTYNLNQLKSEKYITYIGRTDSVLKNLDLLCNVSSLMKQKIRVIGNNSNYINSVKDKINYIGEMSNEEIIKNIIPSSKALILTSHSEGLPFVILEAFSNGIPVIVRDTFTNAKYLTSNNRGVLLDKNLGDKEISKIIETTNWDRFNRESIINFVEKEFSHENFVNSWIYVISEITKNRK